MSGKNAFRNCKEHIYTSGPLLFKFDVDAVPGGMSSDFQTDFFCLYLASDDNIEFIKKCKAIILKCKDPQWGKSLPIRENPDEIARNLSNEEERESMWRACFSFDEYDPLSQPFPVSEMPENLRKKIQKIQKFIDDNYDLCLCLNDNVKVAAIYEKKTTEADMKLVLPYCDAVVTLLYSNTRIFFSGNPDDAYERICRMEDNWILEGNEIHSNGKRTGIDFKNEKVLRKIFF